ncbi:MULTISPECIES: F0F1 ATP synthase subunit B [Myroides]|uniref:ATP synthase subunit b n=1 Tax=Myroides albus TaxID=2562892 RepID=A0A6I3LFB6_9FLAO|nr:MULTISPECIES: F0F1 ATP synthase subunit B [Myroides]MTG96597.1 F0F1 ATP synthase subunit B [Myroides albus]MVX34593.1 F0F1 ATP synthase subunit B [Myroides sp. LoEW2-1]UVD80990.1 F0F1 ATP synthase subunit B [Myroides albus]
MEKLINDFSFGLFFWQFIILLVVVFVLGKFAWKPIVNALEAREAGITDALAAAENAKREMANLKADNEKLLAEARAERDALLKEAREIKEQMIADAKVEAEAHGEKLIAQAKAVIESEKAAAVIDLKNQVSSISIEIAERLLKDQLANKEAQSKLVEKMLDEVKLN